MDRVGGDGGGETFAVGAGALAPLARGIIYLEKRGVGSGCRQGLRAENSFGMKEQFVMHIHRIDGLRHGCKRERTQQNYSKYRHWKSQAYRSDSVFEFITGYCAPHSEHLQKPHGDRNDNHDIQDGPDGGLHGDPIDQPQQEADHDQHNDDI
jgi:hypothetical protein